MLKKIKYIPVFLILTLSIINNLVFAQLEIRKYSINNGGDKMAGGGYEMNSSIAQIDASTIQSGGNFTLNAGFWHRNNSSVVDLIFENGFE